MGLFNLLERITYHQRHQWQQADAMPFMRKKLRKVCDRSARCSLRRWLHSSFGGRTSAMPLVLTNLSPRQDRGACSKLRGGRRLRLTFPVETNSCVGVPNTPTLRLLLLTY